jgi:colanic acid/amylovoran biosynthesis glycosyltransferase
MRREIRALRHLGVALSLYGTRKDDTPAVDAKDLVGETYYLYPTNVTATLGANLRYFLRNPVAYLSGLWRTFKSPEFSLPRRGKMVLHYFLSAPLARHMEEQGITHVHAHFQNVACSIAMFAAEHAHIPYSVTLHSAGTYKAKDTVGLHQKLLNAQFLIMISHYNVDYYDRIVPCRNKSHVIRCGMNLAEFPFHDFDDSIPKNPDKIILLGVGRFVEKKGFRYLIEACHLLKQYDLNFELHIIGSGPLDTELRTQAERLGLQSEVIFLGPKNIAEVRTAMAKADIVIVPSVTTDSGDMEGLPVVIMEAMATGTAVVASAHAGIPEIVIPGETGLLTEERNPHSIANAIRALIDHPSKQQLIRARKLIEQHFNIEVVAHQRLDIFSRYHVEAISYEHLRDNSFL